MNNIPNLDTIAAFDFDGTITTKDSLLPFLFFSFGRWETFKRLIPLIPFFFGYILGFCGRQATKEKILAKFFEGTPSAQLAAKGRNYASSATMKNLLKPEALERVRWHKKQGHKCLIVSASIDAYLLPWGEIMGFGGVICSQLEIDKNGLITGKLSGKNCWGEEKTRRLLDACGPKEKFLLYAYGDSRGDKELLTLADFPFYRRMPNEGS